MTESEFKLCRARKVAGPTAWALRAVAVGALALVCARADAQSSGAEDSSPAAPAVEALVSASAPAPRTTSSLSADDTSRLRQAISAAQGGNVTQAEQMAGQISDPLARRLVKWVEIDSAGSMLSFFDLDTARRDLWGWPRPARRQAAVERSIEAASLSPQRIVEWFDAKAPDTAEGAMALAAAYQQLGRIPEAQALIQRTWREKTFEADAQSRMLARFGIYLTPDDHAKRLDLLLYGAQGPAARAMMGLVTPEVRAVAEARMALRANRDDAPGLVALVPTELQTSPGLAFERARYYRKRNLDVVAVGLVKAFPNPAPTSDEAASAIWSERRALMTALLRSGDAQGAYTAVADNGLPPGTDYTEAEFFAGWIALTKLKNPTLAEAHFAHIQQVGSSPITVSRALYWRGRAADARGDAAAAQGFWKEGGKYYTAFYGQLSAEKSGQTTLALGLDPVPTAIDRARFEGRDLIRAARMLGDAGERNLFRTFVLAADDAVPTAEELALLVDMVHLYGDQDLAMRVVRAGAVRGLYLPVRGYPVRTAPIASSGAEPALVYAITRQESGFDPLVRSGVGARGMMQLMPATAAVVARKVGVDYSPGRLDDPDYNMRLGAAYLGDLVNSFAGSYVLASAAYNAGPGRPAEWTTTCGDPRASATDPADFIECIPFSETRNYVMRILEATQVYRARLNGGSAPLTIVEDLKRGAWGVAPPPIPYQIASLGPAPYEQAAGSPAAPVPYTALAQAGQPSGPVPYSALERAAVQDRVDVAPRSDHERASSPEPRSGKAGRSGKGKTHERGTAKHGGKRDRASRLEHKSKVSKGEGHRGKGGRVAHRKSRR